MLLAIAAIVFLGVRVTSVGTGVIFFAVTAGPIIATMPRRQGVGIALAFVSRVLWPDKNDPLPLFVP